MTDIQSRLLEMLKWYHKFCVTHGLRYYALGGTALGAIRHKGFIPWDDDVDVGMPRPDYERFFELAEKEINGKTPFFAEEASSSSDYICPYGKLYDTRTTLIENSRYRITRGIFLDIFPLDGVGDDLSSCRKRIHLLYLLNMLLAMRVCAINRRRKFYKNMAIMFAGLLPEAILSCRKLIDKIDMIAREEPYGDCKYVGSICNFVGWGQVVEREWLGQPTLVQFENAEIFLPQQYVKYLENIFGDWEKLPPKEQQVSNHDFTYLDLKKSYLE